MRHLSSNIFLPCKFLHHSFFIGNISLLCEPRSGFLPLALFKAQLGSVRTVCGKSLVRLSVKPFAFIKKSSTTVLRPKRTLTEKLKKVDKLTNKRECRGTIESIKTALYSTQTYIYIYIKKKSVISKC